MMDYSAIKIELKKYLAEGDIEKVLDQLNTIIDNKHPSYDELIMLSGRSNALQNSRATGTLSESDFLMERSKLGEGLKLFINHFDEPGFEEPLARRKTASPKTGTQKKNKTNWLKLIAFLQALILLGIAYIIFQLPA